MYDFEKLGVFYLGKRVDANTNKLTDDLVLIREFIVQVGHSRIPVFEHNLDHIVGVLYVKDLVPYLGEDASDFQLRPLLRPPIVVPETKPVRELPQGREGGKGLFRPNGGRRAKQQVREHR